MLKVGMKVRPKNHDDCYTTYTVFIDEYNLHQYKFVNEDKPDLNKTYNVAFIAPHTNFKNVTMVALVDEDTNQCYLMSAKEESLEIVAGGDKMLVKDFLKEFIETFTKKVVGKVAVPNCADTLLKKACDYPLIGTGFHIARGNITASIKDSEGEEMVIDLFRVNIKYSYHPVSMCSLVDAIELEPTPTVLRIKNYKNKSTHNLIKSVRSEILNGNNI